MLFLIVPSKPAILKLPPDLDGQLWFHRGASQVRGMHRHLEPEFNLVTRGRATYLLNQGRYDLAPHSLIWLFPAQEHVLVQESPDFEMWIGVFKPALVRRLATGPSDRTLLESDPEGRHSRLLAADEGRRLDKLFARIESLRNEPNHFNAGLAHALLDTWKAFLEAKDIPTGDVHPAVERTAQLIRAETEPVSMEALAARAGLSVAHLSRLFKQQTGVSLMDFRSRSRVDRFLAIYGNGREKNRLEAALEAGFGSYAQFHRIFKKITGRGPQAYRAGIVKS